MNKKQHNPGEKKKETVFTVQEDALLMEYLMNMLSGKSRNKIKALLTNRQVQVDGHSVSQYNHRLVAGQNVQILGYRPNRVAQAGLDIVYEDGDLVVIDKPAGLLTISTEKEKRETAYSHLRAHVKAAGAQNKIFIVHRLDRDTSGLLVFAKSEKVKKLLQEHWNESIIERSYYAVVEGAVSKDEGTIVSYLFEDKTFRVHSSPVPGRGQKAVTNYTVLKQGRFHALLRVDLETGRKNQIRVHMQELGHPVAGDKKYGAQTNPLNRLGLHAYRLTFVHPVTGEKLKFESKLPSAFRRLF